MSINGDGFFKRFSLILQVFKKRKILNLLFNYFSFINKGTNSQYCNSMRLKIIIIKVIISNNSDNQCIK